jgi:tetratricopeptide (TPR) repeat protein
MADFKYDVFISYSHKDEGWADKVLRQRLDDAGFKVCIDYRDFEAGKMALLNMQDAAKQSKHVVLVLTRNWLNSEWSLFEALMGGTEDPAGLQKKLIPLLCEDGIQKDINPFIAMRTWVDFTRKDREDIAWRQLFDALGKPDASIPAKPKPSHWFYGHRYGDLATFTGRETELKMLNEWLRNDKDNLLMLRALGGFGKSALAWTWFNRVDREQWQTAVWWSFYEKESGFESFLSETLKHLGVEVKQSARQQVNDLLEAMRGTNILIVLDGFERLLRQYGRMDAALVSDDEDAEVDPSQRDCSSPLTETFLRGLSGVGMKSKVLMTTRLCPRVLESADGKLLKGCREEPLAAFSPEDAVTYFHKEEIKARRDEILALCAAYGYHPLSLSLLVGLINEDHEQRGDIEAVKNLEIFEDVRARRHHVLERAYESLAPERRDLLSKISCFRGSMEYAVLKKVLPSADLEAALLDLRKRGLLQYVSPLLVGEGAGVRYDMHPIVRHYAYDRLTTAKRRGVHKRLAKYFYAIPEPEEIETLEDLTPAIELYHHLVRAGNLDEAFELFRDRLQRPLYFQMGAFYIIIELLSDLEISADLEESAIAWKLGTLGNAYGRSGQPRLAVSFFEKASEKYGLISRKHDVILGLGNIALQQILLGNLAAAKSKLQLMIELSEKNKNVWCEAIGHQELGHLLSYNGNWQEAEQEFDSAYNLFDKLKKIQSQSIVMAYRALHTLLMTRDFSRSKSFDSVTAIEFAQQSLDLTKEESRQHYAHPHDYILAHWLLGAAYCANNNLTLAEENLFKALDLCRQINSVDAEADILLDLARLRYAQGDFKDAQEKASEALTITERSGYVLQGADVNLFLAQYALEQEEDKVKAKEYAETALKLATCDGPPYYYKVAYEEAERMLEKLGVGNR